MADPIVSRLLEYLDDSPSPFHAAKEAARLLEEAGFAPVDEAAAPGSLPPGTRGYVLRGGSVVAFLVGSEPAAEAGFRIVTAHTDSPNLRVKPQPLVRGQGYVRLGVEPYGGLILATWTDRDLGMAGRVVIRTEEGLEQGLVDFRQPLCRIPNVAIHLNRKVNDDGLKLNKQTHLPAVFALANDDDEEDDPFRRLLADEVDCNPDDLLAWDLSLYDLAPATLSGAHQEFISGSRLDNLASCHAGLEALIGQSSDAVPASTAVLALFDHEEIGSQTSRGAQSSLLSAVLRRVVEEGENQAAGGLDRAVANSWMVTVDMAHAVHPAWKDKHDPEHMPRLNKGPVIKQNVNARYTTESESAAMFLWLCEAVEAPCQWFVNRSDLACGSTVGPMVAANLGLRSVDVGNSMLAMHSVREMAGSEDHPHMARVLGAFLAG
ncbi:MAG: M18 family aminopeptidase [Deltaproteobacteria bacterium]|nr:M18 family aminopeptidase [Deltaproteobacteria bacterium]